MRLTHAVLGVDDDGSIAVQRQSNSLALPCRITYGKGDTVALLLHQHAGGAIGMETGCFAFFEESEGSQMQCRFGYRMHGIGMGDDTCLGRRGMAPCCVQT